MVLREIINRFEKYNPNFIYELWGNDQIEIVGMNLCNRDSSFSSIISYVTSDKYFDTVQNAIHVKTLIVGKNNAKVYESIITERHGSIIYVDNPEAWFYALHEFLYKHTDFYKKYDFESKIGTNCDIAESAVIENGVIIGNNVIIGANTVIKHGTVIKDNVQIGCNTTIGSEGFQLITMGDDAPLHITHAGGCLISENVYIGDNTCVCNSLFEGYTFVGENVKIDNLVYVAHNLYIEKNAVITAHVILCGSSRIDEGAWIAPNASVINRVTIGAHSIVGMGSVVTKDVPPYAVVYGSPAKEHTKGK